VKTGKTATTEDNNRTLLDEDGCTNGACMDGMVLQQSCWLCPCDEQGIEAQHCAASSGVVIAEQSIVYAASTATSAANKSVFVKRII
jgi:hypothetical protein